MCSGAPDPEGQSSGKMDSANSLQSPGSAEIVQIGHRCPGGRMNGRHTLGAMFGDVEPAALEHRPRTRPECMAFAVANRRAGYTARDTAQALGLSPTAVEGLLFEADHGHERFTSSNAPGMPPVLK